MSKKISKLRLHLDALGLLENGTEEEIAVVKRAYRKQYLLDYKRAQRLAQKEYPVLLSKENGEYETIAKAARRHRLSISAFLRVSALAYLTQTFITIDPQRLAQLEMMLAACVNEIRSMAQLKSRQHWLYDQKYINMEERIKRLEVDIRDLLKNPPHIEAYVRKASPEEKVRILHLLSNDDRQD